MKLERPIKHWVFRIKPTISQPIIFHAHKKESFICPGKVATMRLGSANCSLQEGMELGRTSSGPTGDKHRLTVW